MLDTEELWRDGRWLQVPSEFYLEELLERSSRSPESGASLRASTREVRARQ